MITMTYHEMGSSSAGTWGHLSPTNRIALRCPSGSLARTNELLVARRLVDPPPQRGPYRAGRPAMFSGGHPRRGGSAGYLNTPVFLAKDSIEAGVPRMTREERLTRMRQLLESLGRSKSSRNRTRAEVSLGSNSPARFRSRKWLESARLGHS